MIVHRLTRTTLVASDVLPSYTPVVESRACKAGLRAGTYLFTVTLITFSSTRSENRGMSHRVYSCTQIPTS